MPSLLFAGNVNSYLEIANNVNNDLTLGSGDFTIEWYQYQTDNISYPRTFSIGAYSTQIDIGFSNEDALYFWINSSPSPLNYDTSNIRNNWHHFAIVSYGGTISFYIDGYSVPFSGGPISGQNFVANSNLVIGNESVLVSDSAFGGNMYYFHWMKGFAKYTANFTPTASIPTFDNTYSKLLVTSTGAVGPLANTFTNYNVLVSLLEPSYVPPPPTPAGSIRDSYKSFFTNNSQVYYKAGSMGSTSGVGGVGNYRRKAKFT